MKEARAMTVKRWLQTFYLATSKPWRVTGILIALTLFDFAVWRDVLAVEPDRNSARVPEINGVTATVEIITPVIRAGENLKTRIVFRNTGTRPVAFRFLPSLMEHAVLYSNGERVPFANRAIGEVSYSEVFLKPGESTQINDNLPLKIWYDLVPGQYQIRFYYHLGLLLPNRSLMEAYERHYHAVNGLVPLERRSHSFTVVK